MSFLRLMISWPRASAAPAPTFAQCAWSHGLIALVGLRVTPLLKAKEQACEKPRLNLVTEAQPPTDGIGEGVVHRRAGREQLRRLTTESRSRPWPGICGGASPPARFTAMVRLCFFEGDDCAPRSLHPPPTCRLRSPQAAPSNKRTPARSHVRSRANRWRLYMAGVSNCQWRALTAGGSAPARSEPAGLGESVGSYKRPSVRWHRLYMWVSVSIRTAAASGLVQFAGPCRLLSEPDGST